MLLILLSWIYITFTCVNFGVMINKALGLEMKDFTVNVILGLFGVTLLTSFWVVLFRVNWEFHLVLLLLNITVFISLKNRVTACYKQFGAEFKLLSPILKILLPAVAILIFAQCSSLPYIIDNETYYIQSIKWLNEYGLVRGLANLHPFLAQQSGWHIAQSAFSFSLLNLSFNDLSGFLLLIGNLFAVIKLNTYFKNGDRIYLFAGLLPVANAFLFQFISAPSPDLPVYIFTIIIAFYFIKNYRFASAEAFKLLALLAMFCFYIKPTSAFLLGFPIIYLTKHFSQLKKNLAFITIIGLLTLAAFVTKNTIISGYPLFPYTAISVDADYTLPRELADFYVDMTRRYAFHISPSKLKEASTWELFMHWLSLPGLHGFFNKIAIVLVLISPMLIYKFNKRSLWIVYATMLTQLAFLYVSSPQYRFFFNFILVISLLFIALIFKNKRQIGILLSLCTIATAVLVLVPVNLNFLTKNKLMDKNSTISASIIIYPANNSSTKNKFSVKKDGNINYYSLEASPNFWITGDAPLPAVSREQLKYFLERYGYVPQLRGKSIADGFYSKHVAE